MHRLRFLDTLGVACALLCASHVLVVQNGYACNWHAELVDYTTQETTRYRWRHACSALQDGLWCADTLSSAFLGRDHRTATIDPEMIPSSRSVVDETHA